MVSLAFWSGQSLLLSCVLDSNSCHGIAIAGLGEVWSDRGQGCPTSDSFLNMHERLPAGIGVHVRPGGRGLELSDKRFAGLRIMPA